MKNFVTWFFLILQKNDLTVAEAKAVLNTDGTAENDGEVSAVQTRLEEQQNEIQELKRTLEEQRGEAAKQKQRADDLNSQLEEKVSLWIAVNLCLRLIFKVTLQFQVMVFHT